MTKKLKIWLRAIRAFSFAGSVIPIATGAALGAIQTEFHLGYFVVTLVATLLLHTAVNLFSDHDDYVNKIDIHDAFGSSGVLLEKLLTPEQVRKGGFVALILGCLLGLYLTFTRGQFILYIGIIGAITAYSYTGKPLMFKYRGLGAPLVFLMYGPLMVLGSFYVQSQQISTTSILVSIPLGLLTVGTLHANELRDMKHDTEVGIKTLSIFVGRPASEKIYFGLELIPFIIIFALIVFKIIPIWSLICLITLPVALKNIKVLSISKGDAAPLATLDQQSAKLNLQFGVMLIVAFILSSIIM